jgi:hypothetical protein
VLKREVDPGFILNIGSAGLFFCLDNFERGVTSGPGFERSGVARFENIEAVPKAVGSLMLAVRDCGIDD